MVYFRFPKDPDKFKIWLCALEMDSENVEWK